jgi:DNA-directed RNA polymerase subunit RPC12/RpoP
MSGNHCNSCGKPLLTISGVRLDDRCPYCGADPDAEPGEEGVGVGSSEDRDSGEARSGGSRGRYVSCWYCGFKNPASERRCAECGAELFAVRGQSDEAGAERRLVSTMSYSDQTIYLLEGIKALIRAILKREGNEDGVISCQNRGCRGRYKYDAFRCPQCGGPTLLQQMRAAVEGKLENRSILEELQKAFPQHDIMKYTNAAMMDHRTIAACKLDLEDASRTVASVLETGAEFLRAVTYSGEREEGGGGSEVKIDDFASGPGPAAAPDETVLDLLNVDRVDGGSGAPSREEGGGGSGQAPAAAPDESPEGDWTEP